MRLAAAPDTIKALAKRALFLWPEIETTVRKQDQHQPPGGRGSGSKTPPPPANLTAMQAAHDLHMALLRMARHVDDWTGQPYQYRDAPEAARDVRRYCDVVAEHASRDDVDTADRALRVLERMISPPSPEWYLGVCSFDCERELYAPEREGRIRCDWCGREWDVRARRDSAFNSIGPDQTASLAVITRAFQSQEFDVTYKQLEHWVAKGDIGSVSRSGKKEYNIRDAYRMYRLMEAKRSNAERKKIDN